MTNLLTRLSEKNSQQADFFEVFFREKRVIYNLFWVQLSKHTIIIVKIIILFFPKTTLSFGQNFIRNFIWNFLGHMKFHISYEKNMIWNWPPYCKHKNHANSCHSVYYTDTGTISESLGVKKCQKSVKGKWHQNSEMVPFYYIMQLYIETPFRFFCEKTEERTANESMRSMVEGWS